MTPLIDDNEVPHDRRRPTNGEIFARLEGVEKKLGRILFALRIDNVEDQEAWRTLGMDYDLIHRQRSFAERVGRSFIWAIITFCSLIGITHLDQLKLLVGIK